MQSLRWRFILPFIGLLAIALGGLSIYLSSFIRGSYLSYWQSNLLSESRLVSSQLAPLVESGQPSNQLDRQVKSYASQLIVRITVIASNGTVLSDSVANPADMENHASRPEVYAALQGTESTDIRQSSTLNDNLLYAAVPIQIKDQLVGVTRLAVSLATVEANLETIQRATAGVTLLVIILASLLTLALTGYTTRPLQRLTLAARQMSAGEFVEIPSPDTNDELALLTRTFNQMSVQLKEKIGELETEQGKLAAVLANMTDGVLIISSGGTVNLINPAAARMFKTSESEALGRTLIEVTRQHQLLGLWRTCLDTSRQQTTTLEVAQERIFVQAFATPLEAFLPGSTLLLLQDLTRIRRLETVRRDFVSNVSHELRTPLASLKALAETLQEGALEDPPAARRFLLRMENEIDTLTQMVQELLELSRIESGRVPLEKQPVYPYDLAIPAVERMQLQAQRAGLSLNIDIPEGLPKVLADRERMVQVLVNLLHNAIKFTPPAGSVTVLAYQEGEQVVFAIRDTGVGIPEEDLQRIFERFYKADRARSGGGTGLGLSISRHLVEAHGGRIWAESVANQGSTFCFSIPIALES